MNHDRKGHFLPELTTLKQRLTVGGFVVDGLILLAYYGIRLQIVVLLKILLIVIKRATVREVLWVFPLN